MKTTILLAALLAAGATHADTLYDPATFRPLVAHKRAQRPGDAVTVLIFENSSSSSVADATLRRHSAAGLQAHAQTGSNDPHRAAATAALSSDFSGGGVVQRSERLLAQLTATVTGVAPNGDLLVRGEQFLEVNADRRHIRIEGRVRPADLSESNTVLSNRLADARISYVGDGALAEQQRPGWLARAFAWLGL